MVEEYELEDLAWEIREMFKEYGIRYEQYSPLLFDFRIVKGAPHASTIMTNLGARIFGVAETTNTVSILLVLTKDEEGMCPHIKDTKHILLADIHFKLEPGSPFCYYHFWGRDFTIMEIPREMQTLIGKAIEEQRRGDKEKAKAEIFERMG